MSSDVASAKGGTAAIVGDACLFTAVTVAVGPLCLVLGPAAAWFLHGRRFDRAAVAGGAIGVAVGVLAVGGFFLVLPVVFGAIGPIGGWEHTAPVALLGVAAALFVAVLVALDVDAVRDLAPARRNHARLDVARLVSTLIIVLGAAAVSVIQATDPASEIGDAGVFALGAGVVGAIAMVVGSTVHARWERRGGTAGTVEGA